MKIKNKECFIIGQVVEKVHSQKDNDYTATIIRRFIRNEVAIKELMNLNQTDGDLFKVCEKHTKNNTDFYLCQNLKTKEFTLFGQSGLREHINDFHLKKPIEEWENYNEICSEIKKIGEVFNE